MRSYWEKINLTFAETPKLSTRYCQDKKKNSDMERIHENQANFFTGLMIAQCNFYLIRYSSFTYQYIANIACFLNFDLCFKIYILNLVFAGGGRGLCMFDFCIILQFYDFYVILQNSVKLKLKVLHKHHCIS